MGGWSFMTPTGFVVGLKSIWIYGAMAMTMLAVQWANVAGEEARQVLNEIDFSMYNEWNTYKLSYSLNLDKG